MSSTSGIDSLAAKTIRLDVLDHLRVFGIGEEIPLPLLGGEFGLRPLKEMTGRVLALNATIAVAFGFDRTNALQWLAGFDLLEFLTENEREFLEIASADVLPFRQNVEALFAIAWALNLFDGMSFGELCPTTLVSTFPNLKAKESPEPFIQKCRLRPVLEVVRQADLYYCLDWYVRELRFGALTGSMPLPEYAIIGRRQSFEWMLGGDEWDCVRLDT